MSNDKRGFRPLWLLIPLVAVALPVAIMVYVSADIRKSAARANPNLPPKSYRGDGIAFQYPPDWELTAQDWKDEPAGNGERKRILTLTGLQHESAKVLLFRGPGVLSVTRAAEQFNIGTPISQTKVVATIAGETVMGIQKDYEMALLALKIPFRIRMFILRRSDQTIDLDLLAPIDNWASAEPRFKSFLEHFEAQ